MLPKVTCILLCYNGAELTRACLHSLEQQNYSNLHIVAIDNLSNDNTVVMLRNDFPDVTLIEAGANLGYVGGNNLGIKTALAGSGAIIFLVNNDTLFPPGCISTLVETLITDPRIGAIGPMVYTWDKPRLISSAGGKIDWQYADAINEGMGEADHGQYLARDVDFINGCGLMLRRETIEQVGMLDECYFMYWEETDWCTRIKRAGWRVYFEPAAHMFHKAPIQPCQLSPMTIYYMTRNRLRFFATHTPWPRKIESLAHALIGILRGIYQARQARNFTIARSLQAGLLDALFQKKGQTHLSI